MGQENQKIKGEAFITVNGMSQVIGKVEWSIGFDEGVELKDQRDEEGKIKLSLSMEPIGDQEAGLRSFGILPFEELEYPGQETEMKMPVILPDKE